MVKPVTSKKTMGVRGYPQQRNGRGVRQGNTLANIEINYYFARRSQDGLRFNLIQGKRGWYSMRDVLGITAT